MAELPDDPFLGGRTRGAQLVQTGLQLVEQLLCIGDEGAAMDGLFALEEEDLRAIAIVLVMSAHPSFSCQLSMDYIGLDEAQ